MCEFKCIHAEHDNTNTHTRSADNDDSLIPLSLPCYIWRGGVNKLTAGNSSCCERHVKCVTSMH